MSLRLYTVSISARTTPTRTATTIKTTIGGDLALGWGKSWICGTGGKNGIEPMHFRLVLIKCFAAFEQIATKQ